eukprot:COSAG02_NODE_57213_length_281_cov_1.126374_1_plen_43_part_10
MLFLPGWGASENSRREIPSVIVHTTTQPHEVSDILPQVHPHTL